MVNILAYSCSNQREEIDKGPFKLSENMGTSHISGIPAVFTPYILHRKKDYKMRNQAVAKAKARFERAPSIERIASLSASSAFLLVLLAVVF